MEDLEQQQEEDEKEDGKRENKEEVDLGERDLDEQN